MCGIAGFISKTGSPELLREMTNVLSRRGPDAAGYYEEPENDLGLGHRRLSILDLSESANQPFWSADRRYVIIFNGEIYNYREIAAKYGLQTRTTGDTEVIVEMFARIGTDIFSEMNGMFTLAIWDTAGKTLTIARDRIGIKPLYFTESTDGFFFGSEIKALLKTRKFDINRNSVPNFLYLGYLPSDESLFAGIRKFPPGHFGIYSNGELRVNPFWKAEEKVLPEKTQFRDDTDAKRQLRELLVSSISYRMISDVPLGTFLSGGTDSSTVTALAQQISPHPVKTFTIGFKDAKFNESVHAAQVAKQLGTEHYEFMLSEQQALDQFDKLLDIYDEPFADSSAIPTLLVSEMARRHVTVALSGDGGDELFLGYGMYNWAKRLSNPLLKAGSPAAAALLSMGDNRMKRAANMFRWTSTERIKSHIFSQEQYYFTERELNDLLTPGNPSNLSFNESLHTSRKLNPLEEQSLFDLTNYLRDKLLVKVDRASMHHSLEVRVPILDHRIVEFALNLDMKYKIRGGTTKYLLKQVLYDMVPETLFDRPKWGFGIPLYSWLKTDLKYLVDEYLSDSSMQECGLVNPGVVNQLKKRFFAGEDYLYNRIWVLLILHKWYKKYDFR